MCSRSVSSLDTSGISNRSASGQRKGLRLVGRHRPEGNTDTVVDQLVGIGLPIGQQGVNGWSSDPIEYIGR